MKNDQAALDIVQETFIKVWQRCATFRGDADLLHWLKGILRRTIIDFFRSRRPEQPLDNEEGEMTAEVEAQLAALSAERVATPETILQRHELEICYRRCFARFEAAHPIHAAVMRWVVEDGLTNQEVEALLERSPGATREFISQCRKKARIYLAEWYAMLSDPAMLPDEAANETL